MSFFKRDKYYSKRIRGKKSRKQLEKKITKQIKARINRDIRTINESTDYYKPVRGGSFWNNNYIEYESNDDKHKALCIKDYLDKIKPHLKDTTKNLKQSDAWKIQLTIAINFISSKDNNVECVCVCHALKD